MEGEYNDKAKIDFKTYVTKVKNAHMPNEVVEFIAKECKVKTIGDFVDNLIPISDKVGERFPKYIDKFEEDISGMYLFDVIDDIMD